MDQNNTGMNEGMSRFGGLGNFGDDPSNNNGLNNLMNEDESNMADTIKQLKELWEKKF